MKHVYLAESYKSYFDEAIEKFKNLKIESIVRNMNVLTLKSSKNIDFQRKILNWNKIVKEVHEVRNFLLSYDESLDLPSINKYQVIFDDISKKWRFRSICA